MADGGGGGDGGDGGGFLDLFLPFWIARRRLREREEAEKERDERSGG